MKDEEILETDLGGWPLPDEYLVELGRLAAAWSSLESQLDLYIGKLAGFHDLDDFRPLVLLRHSAFPQKLDMLAALCDQLQHKFSHLAGYSDVVAKLRAAQSSRNRFAHNGLSRDESTGQIQMAIGSARGKVKVQVVNVTLADIRRVAMEIHLAMLALHRLVTQKAYAPIWQASGA